MKVKLLTGLAYENSALSPGQVTEMSKKDVKALIKAGFAEAADKEAESVATDLVKEAEATAEKDKKQAVADAKTAEKAAAAAEKAALADVKKNTAKQK